MSLWKVGRYMGTPSVLCAQVDCEVKTVLRNKVHLKGKNISKIRAGISLRNEIRTSFNNQQNSLHATCIILIKDLIHFHESCCISMYCLTLLSRNLNFY